MEKKSLEVRAQEALAVVKSAAESNPAIQGFFSVFKAGLSEIPGGGAFVYLIDEGIAAHKNARLERFLNEIVEKIISQQAEIDKNRVNTEHYAYMFEQCIRGVSQHPQQEKIDCYKAIIINAAKPTAESDDQQDYFLNLVNSLSVVHIRLIAALNKAGKIPQGGNTPETGRTLRSEMGDIDGDILMSAAAELYQLQFTRTQAESMPFSADLSRVSQRLSPIARKFIEFCTL
jgi:hypothetical protein